MPKIVITDSDFEDCDLQIEMARKEGVEVVQFEDRSPEGIIRNAHDADGVVTSYGNYTAEVFEALPNLKVVSRTGIGYDTIDAQAATRNGTAVCVVPGYGTEVVSDHAIALALACLRRINETDADMRSGVWDYTRRRPFGQVYGRTFGVVGMGEIGRAVAKKASGLGFKVICYSRSLVPGRRTPEGYAILSLEEVLQQSDVVSFHTALTPDTHHLLNADNLALMKQDAVVVNTSRGAVIDTVALAQALSDGKLWGAGIDVFEGEPLDWSHPIMQAPHTVLSPHVAYWSEESGEELARRSMQAALDVVLGRMPADCLNPEVLKSETFKPEVLKPEASNPKAFKLEAFTDAESPASGHGSLDQSSLDQNDSAQSNSGQLDTGESGVDRSGANQPDSTQPDSSQLDTDQQNSSQPGTDQSSTDKPNLGQSKFGKADADQFDSDQSGVDQQNSGEPGTEQQSDSGQSDTDQPDSSKPDKNRPDSDQPTEYCYSCWR